jgi:hypothetical protein
VAQVAKVRMKKSFFMTSDTDAKKSRAVTKESSPSLPLKAEERAGKRR